MGDGEPAMSQLQDPAVLSLYDLPSNAYDEMYDADGAVHGHWRYFVDAVQQLGGDELERRRQLLSRVLHENGVTYNVYGDPQGLNRPWRLDPIPMLISSEEWRSVEAGLAQRATVLDMVLADIYGPQRLIKHGLLPADLVYSHRGFLRPCHHIRPRGKSHLLIYAADLARGPDGRMWVLGDRTQAPSGMGYALENRIAMTQVFPSLFRDCQVHRLAVFFRALRQSLASLAPKPQDEPNIVVLTPGPHNETYFEHAYLAAYLGYLLVQGGDLAVREGRLWLKALEGLQPVDVVLRRLDDDYCDPLELRAESRLGVAGLTEMSRRGSVAIANSLGSGVLENPGLLAFLPGLARRLLGEDMRLPSVATWWCGQEKERQHVLANMHKLVIKMVDRHGGQSPVFGPEMSKKELQVWRARIRARPNMYVGQEVVSFATTPSLVDGQLKARHALLRSFLVAHEGGFVALPGGLTRVATDPDRFIVSNQTGGIGKDTWVLATEPEQQISLRVETRREVAAPRPVLPSRAADSLFWAGRYAERANGVARLLHTVLRKHAARDAADNADHSCFTELLRAVTHVSCSYPGFVGEGAEGRLRQPEEELRAVAFSAERSGSLSHVLSALLSAASGVRDWWPAEGWRMIDELHRDAGGLQRAAALPLATLEEGIVTVLTKLVALAGVADDAMLRDQGWRFLRMGRCLERALLTLSLTRATLTYSHGGDMEASLLEAVLTATQSLHAFRQRARCQVNLSGALTALFFDADSPRSVTSQLALLQTEIAALPRSGPVGLNNVQRVALEAYSQLHLEDCAGLCQDLEGGRRVRLEQLCARLSQLLYRLNEELTAAYFSPAPAPRHLAPVTREMEL